jgi:acyl-CoA dehydrogenase
MMAGAAETMSNLTLEYTHERRQFGQPIARFQAVQHHLVTIAQCAAQLSMVADVAGRGASGGRAAIEIAAAKIIADESAERGTRAAHQAHGAMGVTREYALHHFSRRLWAWRHEFGTGARWRRRLGTHTARAGPDHLFELIAD